MCRSLTCSSKQVGAPFGPEGSWHGLVWLKTTRLNFHHPPEEKLHPLLLIGSGPRSAPTLSRAQNLSGKNETLGRGQNCATHSAAVSQQLGDCWLEHLSLLVLLPFPKQAAVLCAQPHIKLHMHNSIDCKTIKEFFLFLSSDNCRGIPDISYQIVGEGLGYWGEQAK